jgi:hypothetical protein
MARSSVAPPPTRFGAVPAGRTASSLQPKTPRAVPPPPTRFGAALPERTGSVLQPKAPRAVPPPPFTPIRRVAATLQAKPSGVAQPMYYGGGGMGGGYPVYPAGGYYQPYYAPPPPTTQEIEAALANGEELRLVINRDQGYTPWKTKTFPGFNIEFPMIFGGQTLMVHVKWNASIWCDQDPYALSLKLDNSPLENPTLGSHPNLWRHLLHAARKIVANSYARHLLVTQYGSPRVTLAMINDLIANSNRQGLYALYTADATPLSLWDHDAWSEILDWMTKG